MFSVLPVFLPFSLALRNMRTRVWRTILTLAGIILGVAVVLAIQITNASTLESIRAVFDRAAGQANLLVVGSGGAGSNARALDAELVDQIASEPDILVAAPSVQVQTYLARDAGSFRLDFTLTGVASGTLLQVYGIDPELDPQVRVYELTSGRLPEPERYEAVISQEYAVEKSLELDDDLVIITPQGSARLRITGMLSAEGVGLLNEGSVAFAPLEVVQELFEASDQVEEIAVRAAPEVGESPRLLERLKTRLEETLGDDADVIYPSARGELVPAMLNTYQQGLAFFSAIAVFVGAFLIYNTFTMTVIERTREIGMLRAIGMNRMQVIRMVLAEAGILSLIGSAAGVLLGVFMSRGLIRLMGGVAGGEERAISIPPEGLLQSLLVGIVVTLGASLLPSLQAARTSPLEALRARGRSNTGVRKTVWIAGMALLFAGWYAIYGMEWREEVLFGVGSTAVLAILLGATLTVPLVVALIERFTRPLSQLVYHNEGALGSANVRRSVGRTTLTVAALMVALTMVIAIGSLAHSLEQDITQWIDTALGGDLYVRSGVTMRESFGRQLLNIPGVQAVTPARYINVRVASSSAPPADKDTLTFNAIDPVTYRQVGDMEFASGQGDPEAIWDRLSDGNAILVSNSVADAFNVRQGDSLTLLTHRGEQAFFVAGEVVDFTGQGYTVIGTYDDLHRWFAERDVDRYTIKVAPGANTEAVAEEIEERYGARRGISVQTTEVFKSSIRGLMDRAFRLFDVLNMIAILIGALGVINTLTMNVIERQREIGGLRSLGMTRTQVLRMILAESLAMGLIGAVYGLSFGWVVAQIMILGMNLLNGYELVYIFTARPFVIGVLIAFLVSQVAALIPARGAASLNIVEAIKHE